MSKKTPPNTLDTPSDDLQPVDLSDVMTLPPPRDEETGEIIDLDPPDPPNPLDPPESDDEPIYDEPELLSSANPNAVSEFQPSPEEVEAVLRVPKGPGRPKKREIEPTGVQGEDRPQLVLPTPPYRRFKADATSRQQTTKALWAWVKSMPDWAKQRAQWYVYREWPVLIDRAKDKNIDKYPVDGDSAINDDTDLLKRYGCGDYYLILNIAGAGKVAEAWVKNLGGGRLRDNPPTDSRVSNPKEVEWTNPANKSYEQYMRANGKGLTGIGGGEGEDEDMAQAQLVRDLTDKIVTMAEKTVENQKNQAPTQNIEADAVSRAMDMVVESSTKAMEVGNKIIQDTMTQAAKMREGNSAATTTAQDPMVMLTALLGLIEKMNPKNNVASQEVAELRVQLANLQANQIKSLQDELRELRTRPAEATGVEAQIKVFKEFRDLMREEMEQNGAGEEVNDAMADAAPKWLRPYIPVLGPVLMGLAQQFLGPKGTPPVQMANPFPQSPAPFPQPPQQQLGPPPGGFPPPPHMNVAPPPPGPQLVQDPMTQQINAFISLMAPGMMTALKAGKSGIEYADSFIDWFGESAYDELLGLKLTEMDIKNSLTLNPGLGPQLSQFPDVYINKFIHEFMNYDALTDGSIDGKPETVTPPVAPNGGAA